MISPKSIKILWSAAAGRCSYTDCWEKLCSVQAGGSAPFTIGEMAHIRGDKQGSNRHDPSQSDAERDDYSNLILLCPTHHRLIDRKENEARYTVELLHEMKRKHEAKVLDRLEAEKTLTRENVAAQISALLEENHESWSQYGPLSEIARREPHNNEVHAVWMSERLSIIVPNNRIIAEMLKFNRKLFHSSEQKKIASFLIHARSYESWVRDEIPYKAVVRFPLEFVTMIRKVIDASA